MTSRMSFLRCNLKFSKWVECLLISGNGMVSPEVVTYFRSRRHRLSVLSFIWYDSIDCIRFRSPWFVNVGHDHVGGIQQFYWSDQSDFSCRFDLVLYFLRVGGYISEPVWTGHPDFCCGVDQSESPSHFAIASGIRSSFRSRLRSLVFLAFPALCCDCGLFVHSAFLLFDDGLLLMICRNEPGIEWFILPKIGLIGNRGGCCLISFAEPFPISVSWSYMGRDDPIIKIQIDQTTWWWFKFWR